MSIDSVAAPQFVAACPKDMSCGTEIDSHLVLASEAGVRGLEFRPKQLYVSVVIACCVYDALPSHLF